MIINEGIQGHLCHLHKLLDGLKEEMKFLLERQRPIEGLMHVVRHLQRFEESVRAWWEDIEVIAKIEKEADFLSKIRPTNNVEALWWD